MVIIYGNVLCLIVTAHHICETPAGGTERVREREAVWLKDGVIERHTIHTYITRKQKAS